MAAPPFGWFLPISEQQIEQPSRKRIAAVYGDALTAPQFGPPVIPSNVRFPLGRSRLIFPRKLGTTGWHR